MKRKQTNDDRSKEVASLFVGGLPLFGGARRERCVESQEIVAEGITAAPI